MQKSSLIISALTLVSTIGVLNIGCSSSSGSRANSSSASVATAANDIGFVFVHASLSGLCADGQLIDSSLEVHSGIAYLTRDNCADIPAVSQRQLLIQIDPLNSSYVVYNSLSYTDSLISFNATTVDVAGNVYSLAVQTAPLTLVQYRVITKYSAQGSLLWAKRLPTDLSSDLTSLRITNNGNLVVSGKTSQHSSHAALLVVLNPQGSVLTQAAFSPAPTQTANFRDIEIDSNGNIYAVGEIRHANDNYVDCVVVKINPAGQIVWQSALTNLNAWISQIRLTTDETALYISGHFDSSSYLGGIVKFTKDGTQEWSSNLPGTVYSIENSFDGGLMLAGIIQANNEGFVAKLAGAGIVAWSTTFRSNNESLGYVRGITQRSDGSFLLSGLAIRGTEGVVGTVTSLTSAGALDWSFEVSRTGFDGFQDGESNLLDGKLWMSLRTTVSSHGMAGILFRFLDQAVQPTCSFCTVRSDIIADDAGLALAAGSSFTTQTLLSPLASNITLTDVLIKADVRP